MGLDNEAEIELTHDKNWSALNGLRLNLNKTKEIVIRKMRLHNFKMSDPVYNIEQVKQVTLLGLQFNCYLNFV